MAAMAVHLTESRAVPFAPDDSRAPCRYARPARRQSDPHL